MHDAGNCGDVHEPMKAIPVAAAQATNRSCRRGEGQRNHRDKSGEADGDVRALVDIVPDGGGELAHGAQRPDAVTELEPGEAIGDHVDEKMQRPVKKREEAGHAAKANQRVPAADPPHRRHRDGDHDEAQGPVAGRVSDLFDRIRTEILRVGVPSQKPNRHKARNEHHDFYKTNHS